LCDGVWFGSQCLKPGGTHFDRLVVDEVAMQCRHCRHVCLWYMYTHPDHAPVLGEYRLSANDLDASCPHELHHSVHSILGPGSFYAKHECSRGHLTLLF
jgi:hypothetical protein